MRRKNIVFILWLVAFITSLLVAILVGKSSYKPNGCDGGLCFLDMIASLFYGVLAFTGAGMVWVFFIMVFKTLYKE